jgi:DNA-binding transcriptional regulator YiaG
MRQFLPAELETMALFPARLRENSWGQKIFLRKILSFLLVGSKRYLYRWTLLTVISESLGKTGANAGSTRQHRAKTGKIHHVRRETQGQAMTDRDKEPETMPDLSRDLMLTIDQISQLTGVRKSTLRYWEKSFDQFLHPSRTHSNRREYTIEDLDRIKTIKRLLEQEHLTAHGVRLRLMELFARERESEPKRKAKPAGVDTRP